MSEIPFQNPQLEYRYISNRDISGRKILRRWKLHHSFLIPVASSQTQLPRERYEKYYKCIFSLWLRLSLQIQTNTQIKIQIQIEEQEQCQPAWQGAAIITCSTYRTGRAASLKVQTIIYYHCKELDGVQQQNNYRWPTFSSSAKVHHKAI